MNWRHLLADIVAVISMFIFFYALSVIVYALGGAL